jgi:phage repressor protein C with HTH and peptisase S24 domain
MDEQQVRARLEQLARQGGDDFAALSRMLGKNPAYVQQYLRRGTPKRLAEEDRALLADYYGISERELGAPERSGKGAQRDWVALARLDVAAAAGAGGLAEADTALPPIGFACDWLAERGIDADRCAIIRVTGDSMEPTLSAGDDIMVDQRARHAPLRDGIHVLRHEGALLVKRLALQPGGGLLVRSDNPLYPDWPVAARSTVDIIGRVIWVGKTL